MDQQQEQLVMQAFYDRIFQMVTYSPGTGDAQGVSVANPDTTLVQLDTVGSIQLDDYKNMASPDNIPGDLAKAQAFYDRFNVPGGIAPTYKADTSNIGTLYAEIVNGADSDLKPSTEQVTEYNNARNYLYTTVKTVNPLTQQTTESQGYTTVFKHYQACMNTYALALQNYRSTYLNFDMSDPKQQQKFEAQAPVLQTAIDHAWNDWETKGNKAMVEQVLAFLASSDNDIVANIIEDARELMKSSAQTSLEQGGGSWWLSYGSPSNWWDPSNTAGWMGFSLNSNYLTTSDSSYYSQYQQSAGASFLGLISWNESSSGSTNSTTHHMEGDNLAISGQMMNVTIERPWFSNALLNTGGWSETDQPPGWISEGSLASVAAALQAKKAQFMPVVPTSFVLVKNVSMTANWTSQDSSNLTTAAAASGGCTFGPFHAGGSGASGSSHSTSTTTFSGGTLSMPDAQIVAWVNQITPKCPPLQG